MKVYFDNAATTPLDKEVLEAMMPFFNEDFGNPSSIHSFGRKTRSAVENSRKSVAKLIGASPSEIFFTSGGTEADNMALTQTIASHNIQHVISSPIEHHAVEHTLKVLESEGKISLSWVKIDGKGNVDLNHLEELLKKHERSLVSLMHANNEIGTLLPIDKVGELCKKYNAFFHSDTVQTLGHYAFDLSKMNVHLITCAAHKFHGPKGVGFIYINQNVKIKPFIYGGAQERNMRGGTENVAGIIGLAKALEIAMRDLDSHQKAIADLKQYMKTRLEEAIPGILFNGETGNNSLYTVLNCSLPPHENAEMLLFNLDIAGVAASGGSACSSGSEIGSHVLQHIGSDKSRPAVRFSFSKLSTKDEVEFAIEKLQQFYAIKEKIA